MKAVIVRQFGGPEALALADLPTPRARSGEVVVRVHACGVCYHDVLNRQGRLPRTRTPAVVGHEIAGSVVEMGKGVQGLDRGDRVASVQFAFCGSCPLCRDGRPTLCAHGPGMIGEQISGGYAEMVALPAQCFRPVPREIDDPEAAILACTLGTAWHAFRKQLRLRRGETALITGAGGGVGIHAVQVAKLLGARVIGLTSSVHKVTAIRQAGADEVICCDTHSFHKEVKATTGGLGVDVILDSVGGHLLEPCLRSLARGGRLALVGNLGTGPAAFPPGLVILKELEVYGSYATTPEELDEVIGMVRSGDLRPLVSQTLPLEDAAEAHRLVESRKPIGRVVLTI